MQKCGFLDKKLAGEQPRLVKLQRPPPEIRIFGAGLFERSRRSTERPLCLAVIAYMKPAAPAPMMIAS